MTRIQRVSVLLRNSALGVSAVALAAGGLLLSGAAASAEPTGVRADTGDVSLMGLAPSCIAFTQYQHESSVGNHHTNVYLDNNCGRQERVKVIMANGYDSGCLQMEPGLLDKKFTSFTNNGGRPYVDRLDSC